MNQRTPKAAIAGRSFIGVLGISILMGLAWNALTGTVFWTLGPLVAGSLFIVVGFGFFGWFVVNVGTRLICGRDPEFQNYVRNGGDPYFDTLPYPLNPDSELTRLTGLQEPQYDSFIPPVDWKFQCPRCGARVEHRIDVCWRCSYGKDCDSTAYYKRWGHLGKPADVPDDKWDAIGNS